MMKHISLVLFLALVASEVKGQDGERFSIYYNGRTATTVVDSLDQPNLFISNGDNWLNLGPFIVCSGSEKAGYESHLIISQEILDNGIQIPAWYALVTISPRGEVALELFDVTLQESFYFGIPGVGDLGSKHLLSYYHRRASQYRIQNLTI